MFFRLGILFISLLGCITPASGAQIGSQPGEEPIAIYYYDRVPYRIFISKNDASGILVDITKQALKSAGIDYQFRIRPFRRIMRELLSPEVHGCVPGIYKTTKREKLYLYSSHPLLVEKPMAIVINIHKASRLPQTPGIKALFTSGLTMGVYNGFSYGKWYDDKMTEYSVKSHILNFVKGEEVTRTAHMAKMVAINRVDYTLMAPIEARWILKHNKNIRDQVKILTIRDAPKTNDRYLVCSKAVGLNNMNKINTALSQLLASATYQQILSEYY
ncbi:substrate-binding periplasmic protein [Dongshaea marina]|uniref:substrate-binding periplasmic protein n=1 Tax=Dongshaea marina TaxID=2047966 RepID=UPI000D3EB108|nr:transporter substrate-binding domain-containing protein [Dongshaea marina]